MSGCRIECETEAIYEEFGCRLVESPGDYPVCSPEQLDWAEAKLGEYNTTSHGHGSYLNLSIGENSNVNCLALILYMYINSNTPHLYLIIFVVTEEIEKSDSCLCHNPCHATQYPYKLSFLEVRESTVERLQTEHSIPAALTKYNPFTALKSLSSIYSYCRKSPEFYHGFFLYLWTLIWNIKRALKDLI